MPPISQHLYGPEGVMLLATGVVLSLLVAGLLCFVAIYLWPDEA